MRIGSKLSVILLDTREMALSPQQLINTLQTLGHLIPTEAKIKTNKEINIQQAGKQ